MNTKCLFILCRKPEQDQCVYYKGISAFGCCVIIGVSVLALQTTITHICPVLKSEHILIIIICSQIGFLITVENRSKIKEINWPWPLRLTSLLQLSLCTL